jgi:ketosteroid isomerase-like protein
MAVTNLARPIATYIAAANAQDVDAVAACFSETAVVHDEKRERQGLPAIRNWAKEVSEKYRPIVEPLDVAETNERTILTGRISGNFPGSPIELRYAFTLIGEKIARLEIT